MIQLSLIVLENTHSCHSHKNQSFLGFPEESKMHA